MQRYQESPMNRQANALNSYSAARQTPREVRERAVRELTEEDRPQVLALLSEDPLRAVLLRGRIQDRPLDDPGHRGIFFGYFEDDQLAGVALLGHHILIYAEDAALPFFAQAAAESQAKGHLILGPQAQVEAFWEHISQSGRETRMVSFHRW